MVAWYDGLPPPFTRIAASRTRISSSAAWLVEAALLSLSGRVYPARIWASAAQTVVDASAAEVAEQHAASAEAVD